MIQKISKRTFFCSHELKATWSFANELLSWFHSVCTRVIRRFVHLHFYFGVRVTFNVIAGVSGLKSKPRVKTPVQESPDHGHPHLFRAPVAPTSTREMTSNHTAVGERRSLSSTATEKSEEPYSTYSNNLPKFSRFCSTRTSHLKRLPK